MSWTDERVEKLKKMWCDGQSSSEIAKDLGGVTRNAVIGKIHRLGLSNRKPGGRASSDRSAKAKSLETAHNQAAPHKTQTPEPKAVVAKQPAVPVSKTRSFGAAGHPLTPKSPVNEVNPDALARVNEIEKKALKLSLMDLTERTCRWPVGDPSTDDFWFCGLPVLPGKPYCETCDDVAYHSTNARRDRRR